MTTHTAVMEIVKDAEAKLADAIQLLGTADQDSPQRRKLIDAQGLCIGYILDSNLP